MYFTAKLIKVDRIKKKISDGIAKFNGKLV